MRTMQTQTDETVYRGLCRSCVGRATCTYPRPKDRQVLFCAEFEGELLHPARPYVAMAAPEWKPQTRMGNPDPEESAYKGLCRTCEKRSSCTFPKPLGGVWHCEEFE